MAVKVSLVEYAEAASGPESLEQPALQTVEGDGAVEGRVKLRQEYFL